MTFEENGHRWRTASSNDRCVFCQIKFGYYMHIKRASKEQPKRQDLKEWLKCKTKELAEK